MQLAAFHQTLGPDLKKKKLQLDNTSKICVCSITNFFTWKTEHLCILLNDMHFGAFLLNGDCVCK